MKTICQSNCVNLVHNLLLLTAKAFERKHCFLVVRWTQPNGLTSHGYSRKIWNKTQLNYRLMCYSRFRLGSKYSKQPVKVQLLCWSLTFWEVGYCTSQQLSSGEAKSCVAGASRPSHPINWHLLWSAGRGESEVDSRRKLTWLDSLVDSLVQKYNGFKNKTRWSSREENVSSAVKRNTAERK